jgi:thiosulfate dehydrogenase [quinone] large subunit
LWVLYEETITSTPSTRTGKIVEDPPIAKFLFSDTRPVAISEQGRPPIAFDWYRGFIQMLIDSPLQTWFGPLVAYGEFLIGITLIVGAFTGIAAFFGAFMNWNFIMAGTASTNALLLVAAVILILGWEVAGYIGADYFLLRYLGTPWRLVSNEPAKVGAGAD